MALKQKEGRKKERTKNKRIPKPIPVKAYLKKYKYGIIMVLGFITGISLLSFTIGRSLVLGESPSLPWFSLIHFLGYLFFILSTVELLFIHMSLAGHDIVRLIVIAVSTAIPAQVIDYYIGYAVSDRIIIALIGEKRYRKSLGDIKKYGNPTIFLINLSPLSSPILILVAGMIRYDYKNVLLYSLLGLTVKYTFLALMFQPS